jgi:hypothetical protein
VNPSGVGSAAMARAVASAMRTNCIGQPPSAGCCAR